MHDARKPVIFTCDNADYPYCRILGPGMAGSSTLETLDMVKAGVTDLRRRFTWRSVVGFAGFPITRSPDHPITLRAVLKV